MMNSKMPGELIAEEVMDVEVIVNVNVIEALVCSTE